MEGEGGDGPVVRTELMAHGERSGIPQAHEFILTCLGDELASRSKGKRENA